MSMPAFTTTYDPKVRQLIAQCEQLSVTGDPGAPRHFRRLEKLATEAEDTALLGYVCYYAANWYYDAAQIEQFYAYLKKAIDSLLRSREYELLARAYNLFAIYAWEGDVYEIAYSYFLNALSIIEGNEKLTVAGVILGNLAGFHYESQEYKLARRNFRKAIRLMLKDTGDPFHQRNLLAAYVNDGLNSLAMGDLEDMEKNYLRARKIVLAGDYAQFLSTVPAYRFFEAQRALAMGDIPLFREKFEACLKFLKEETFPEAYMVETRDFCYALIRAGENACVRRVLDTIEGRLEDSDFTVTMRMLTQIKVSYYDSVHNEKELMRCLMEQHRLLLRQNEERKKIFRFSVELVRLVGELQEEEKHVRLENRDLRKRALTDGLTRIPNREALDMELEKVLSRAAKDRSLIGVEILDIDEFKSYNDDLGHRAGDACLEEVGRVLQTFGAKHDVFCARFGGDEFVLIYESMTAEEIRTSAEELGAAIAACTVTLNKETRKRSVTVSQGICTGVPDKDSSPWDFLAEADVALYAVKNAHDRKSKSGGVRIREHTPAKRKANRKTGP